MSHLSKMASWAFLLFGVLSACTHSQPAPPPVVDAAKNTLSWDRINMALEYHVYAAWLPGCEVGMKKAASTMLKVVQQAPVGTRPSYWRELSGSVGCYAVTQVDMFGNESAFSVPLAFDRR